MLRHILLITYRSFLRNKSSFLINLIGLSTGLACVLLIYLWVNDELQVDKFHEKDEQLYQVFGKEEFSGKILSSDIMSLPLAEVLVEEIPEVEYAVSINDFSVWRNKEGILSFDEKNIEAKGWLATKDFFDVFSYRLLDGEKDQIMSQRDGILLSEELALKLFNTTENLLGKTLAWKHSAFEETFQVSGIFESPPANSTDKFDFVGSMDVFHKHLPYGNAGTWASGDVQTYVILHKGTNIEEFNAKIANLAKEKSGYEDFYDLYVQNYSSTYLYSKGTDEYGRHSTGRITYVRLFSVVALFILLIACVNFMNLYTARASVKMKEIGVKKTLGARRRSLAIQFLTESSITTFISFQIALLFVLLILPQFNEFTGKELDLSFGYLDLLIMGAIVVFTGLFSGFYPALYLSGFKPMAVLKGKLRTSTGALWVRKGLVVFQFAISIIFIVAFLVVNEQIKFAQSKNMGYDRDNIISFQWQGELYDSGVSEEEAKTKNAPYNSFRERLKNLPGIVSTTNMSGNILNEIYKQSGISYKGDESGESYELESPVVGYNFIETLGIELLEGRTFSKEFNDDYTKVILNQAAVKLFNIENPIGERLNFSGGAEIIGVVDDFHYGSLYNSVEPLFFRCVPFGRNIMVRIEAGTEKSSIERIKQLYEEFLPKYTFSYSFMDDDYQALYESEIRVAALSNYFAILAILISCLGLFGLAAFTTEQRAKEIGIRKVLGSSAWNIVNLISRDFTKMVFVAILVALPLSYFISNRWLESFVFKIELQWWYFIGAGLLALLITWLTVGVQTFKAASTRPVHVLRDE